MREMQDRGSRELAAWAAEACRGAADPSKDREVPSKAPRNPRRKGMWSAKQAASDLAQAHAADVRRCYLAYWASYFDEVRLTVPCRPPIHRPRPQSHRLTHARRLPFHSFASFAPTESPQQGLLASPSQVDDFELAEESPEKAPCPRGRQSHHDLDSEPVHRERPKSYSEVRASRRLTAAHGALGALEAVPEAGFEGEPSASKQEALCGEGLEASDEEAASPSSTGVCLGRQEAQVRLARAVLSHLRLASRRTEMTGASWEQRVHHPSSIVSTRQLLWQSHKHPLPR